MAKVRNRASLMGCTLKGGVYQTCRSAAWHLQSERFVAGKASTEMVGQRAHHRLQAVGVGHIEWPSQFPQGKVSTESLGKGPSTDGIGQAVGVGHIGWPSQLAQGKLSTERLGQRAHHRLHWTGSGG